mgnify:CR=1 FL=1
MILSEQDVAQLKVVKFELVQLINKLRQEPHWKSTYNVSEVSRREQFERDVLQKVADIMTRIKSSKMGGTFFRKNPDKLELLSYFEIALESKKDVPCFYLTSPFIAHMVDAYNLVETILKRA